MYHLFAEDLSSARSHCESPLRQQRKCALLDFDLEAGKASEVRSCSASCSWNPFETHKMVHVVSNQLTSQLANAFFCNQLGGFVLILRIRCFTGQHNTLRGKGYQPSSTYMSSKTPVIG